MVFSDPIFIYFFLPICLLVYWALAGRARNPFVCVVGSVFYMWGAGPFIVLLLTTIVVNHSAATQIARDRTGNRQRGRWIVRGVIVADLAALGFWKYGPFTAEQAGRVFRHLGINVMPVLHATLPIAISFYTFQCISYVVDVWRGTAVPAPRLVDFAAYILLFPHLIAGPIVRFAHIEDDLIHPSRKRFEDFTNGAPRFFWGLGKKVIIADQVAAIANRVFAVPNAGINTGTAWIGVLAFSIQIYFDFSGYSDMAIGLARMLGFHFPENFDRPYSSRSITEFWRRWHMSLSSWFRDYVYIPLGGNRRGPARTYFNLSIVFLLTGLWHGANWTFIVWGMFHGACLVVERATGLGRDSLTRLAWLRRIVTFGLVCVGWAIFRANDLGQASTVIHSMVIPNGFHLPIDVAEVVTRQRVFWLLVGSTVVLFPARARIGQWVTGLEGRWGDAMRLAIVGAIAPVAAIYTLSSSFSPFLYFKF
jgi:alginate O-acetyltransferase complex protein AlgI